MFPHIRRLLDIVALARPFNAFQPLFLFIFGVIVAGGKIGQPEFYVCLVVILLLHSAITIWNDLNDQAVDRHNHVKTILTEGYVSGRTLRYIIASCVLVSAGLCVVFLPVATTMLMGVLLLIGWQYSAQPIRASHRPIMSMLFLAVSYGALPVLIGASLGVIHGQIWLYALAWSLARVSLSLLKDYKDAVGDARVDKKTFLLRFGHQRVVIASIASLTIGYVAVFGLAATFVAAQYMLPLVVIGCLVVGFLVIERLRLRNAKTYQSQHDLFRESMYIQLAVDGGLVLWLMQLVIF